jgi:hypothetical protein
LWMGRSQGSLFLSAPPRRCGTKVTPISSSDLSSYPFHHVSYLSISLLAVTLPLPHLVYHCFSVDVCFRSRGGCQIDSMIQRQRWMPK